MTTAYANETPENFRYRVILWSTDFYIDDNHWYVHDTKRNKFIRIGKVQLKGTNYFDRAIEFCKQKETIK